MIKPIALERVFIVGLCMVSTTYMDTFAALLTS